MNKDLAITFQQELESLCEKNNAFCFVTYEKKPHLTGIKMEVSIKVDNNKSVDNARNCSIVDGKVIFNAEGYSVVEVRTEKKRTENEQVAVKI